MEDHAVLSGLPGARFISIQSAPTPFWFTGEAPVLQLSTFGTGMPTTSRSYDSEISVFKSMR